MNRYALDVGRGSATAFSSDNYLVQMFFFARPPSCARFTRLLTFRVTCASQPPQRPKILPRFSAYLLRSLLQIPAFVFCRPVTWHKSRRISLLQTLSCPEPRRVRRKKTSTPLQSGESRLFLQNTRGGGVYVTAPSASPRLFPSLTLSPLCFHGLTNCFSRKPFVLITLCVAPRVCHPSVPPASFQVSGGQDQHTRAHSRTL